MEKSSVVTAVVRGLSEWIPGLRPNAPRRNTLVVLVYGLGFLIGVGLLKYLAVAIA